MNSDEVVRHTLRRTASHTWFRREWIYLRKADFRSQDLDHVEWWALTRMASAATDKLEDRYRKIR